MSTPWRASARILFRKKLKAAGLDSKVLVSNNEGTLEAMEVCYLYPREKGGYLPSDGVHTALNNHMYRVEYVHEEMAVVRLVHVTERTRSGKQVGQV